MVSWDWEKYNLMWMNFLRSDKFSTLFCQNFTGKHLFLFSDYYKSSKAESIPANEITRKKRNLRSNNLSINNVWKKEDAYYISCILHY